MIYLYANVTNVAQPYYSSAIEQPFDKSYVNHQKNSQCCAQRARHKSDRVVDGRKSS